MVWVFIYELRGYEFDNRCSHLNFKYFQLSHVTHQIDPIQLIPLVNICYSQYSVITFSKTCIINKFSCCFFCRYVGSSYIGVSYIKGGQCMILRRLLFNLLKIPPFENKKMNQLKLRMVWNDYLYLYLILSSNKRSLQEF